MKKILSLLALTALATPAMALDASLGSSAWACGDLATTGVNQTASTARYCTAKVTSATTATQLGNLQVNPVKAIYTFTAGPAAINTVSSTWNLKLSGAPVGNATVSNTAAGNPAAYPVVYFNTMTVSVSTPATISSTNALQITVVEK